MIFLHLPTGWYQIAQRIQIVTPWKINLQENHHSLECFLRCLLCEPADMTRHNCLLLNECRGSLQVFPGVAQPAPCLREPLSFVHRALCLPVGLAVTRCRRGRLDE